MGGMHAQSLILSDSLPPRGLPGSVVHGISQARILKWVAISFSRWYARVILFDSV